MWWARAERTRREKGIHNGMPLNVAVQMMWPTPVADNAVGGRGYRDDGTAYPGRNAGMSLVDAVRLRTSWPTPVRGDGERSSASYPRGNATLLGAVNAGNTDIGLWATPRSEGFDAGRHRGQADSLHSQVKALWATPSASDGTGGKIAAGISATGMTTAGRKRQVSLNQQTREMWATPAAQDGKNVSLPPSQARRDTLPGDLMRGGARGTLNPDWVETLMGAPAGWTDVEMAHVDANPSSWPGWPAGRGDEQHDWEPPRTTTKRVRDRRARLQAIGNGVVRQQFALVFAAIVAAESEREQRRHAAARSSKR